MENESGMNERLLRCTFDNFHVTPDNNIAYETAKGFADVFNKLLPTRGVPHFGKNGLFITGQTGPRPLIYYVITAGFRLKQ